MLRSIQSKFSSLTTAERSLIIFLAAIFGFLFFQCFQGPDLLDFVYLRDDDDGQFQSALRTYHLGLLRGDIFTIFHMNRFSYGWIFWFPRTVLTLPAYGISRWFGVDSLLISGPSVISVICSIGAMYFVYQIVSCYTRSGSIRFAVLAIIALSPAFGYLSVKFHPTSQNFLFNTWVVYLLVRKTKYTPRDLYWIAGIVGASAATKLTGVLIGPCVALFILDRLGWKLRWASVKLILKSLGIFVIVTLFLSNPGIVLSPFRPSIVEDQWAEIASVLNGILFNRTLDPLYENPWFQAKEVLFGTVVAPITGLFCALLYVLCIVTRYQDRGREFLYFFVTICFGLYYTCFRVKIYTLYAAPHFMTLSFLVPMSLVWLETRRPWGACVALVLIPINLGCNLGRMFGSLSWNPGPVMPYNLIQARYSHLNKSHFPIARHLREEIEKLFSRTGKIPIVLADENFPVLYPVSLFPRPHAKWAAFGEEGELDANPKEPYEYVVIRTSSRYWVSTADFESYYQSLQDQISAFRDAEEVSKMRELVKSRKEKGLKIREAMLEFKNSLKMGEYTYELVDDTPLFAVYRLKGEK